MQYIFRILMVLLSFAPFAARADTEADSSALNFHSDLLGHPYASYKAENTILFYKHYSEGENRLLPTGAYIIKGDYFIARPMDKDGYFYAAYIPKGAIKPSAEGYIKPGNFSEVKLENYGIPNQKWQKFDDKGRVRTLSFHIETSDDGKSREWKLEVWEEKAPGVAYNPDTELRGTVYKNGDNSFFIGKGITSPDMGAPIYTLSFKNGNPVLSHGNAVLTGKEPLPGSDYDYRGEYEPIAPCSRAEDILLDKNVRSYKAEGKLPFYKHCPQDSRALCPTGSYIVKGDYFIAARQKDGELCAVYMPESFNRPKALGYIQDASFSETAKSEYRPVFGSWRKHFSHDDEDTYLYIRAFDEGGAIAFISETEPGAEDGARKLLKIGNNSFISVIDAVPYDLRLSKNRMTLSRHGFGLVKGSPYQDELVDNSYELAGCSSISGILSVEGAASYKAGGDIPFFKKCAGGEGLCPMNIHMQAGDYFVAFPAANGDYCAAYMPEGYKKPKAVGFIHPGNFARTAAEEYKAFYLESGKVWSDEVDGDGKTDHDAMTLAVLIKGKSAAPSVFWNLSGESAEMDVAQHAYHAGDLYKIAPQAFISYSTESSVTGYRYFDTTNFYFIYDVIFQNGKMVFKNGSKAFDGGGSAVSDSKEDCGTISCDDVAPGFDGEYSPAAAAKSDSDE